MSEYDQVDFEMFEDEEDAYDGPDAYLDGEDNVVELEERSLRESPRDSRESSSISQVLLCEFVRCTARSAYAHCASCSVI
jgi:hypothetical protein